MIQSVCGRNLMSLLTVTMNVQTVIGWTQTILDALENNMNNEEFNVVLERRINDLRETLSKKGAEYAPNVDRLQNFKDAAEFQGITQAQALLGFVSKHIVALKDFINLSSSGDVIPPEQWDEKIGDICCYMILLNAVLVEEGKM